MVQADLAASAAVVFSDLPPSEGERWLRQFPKHSARSFIDPLTYEGYKGVNISYLLCEEDKCVPSLVQKMAIEVIEKAGQKVDVTSLTCGHCPSLSKTNEVLNWILNFVVQV